MVRISNLSVPRSNIFITLIIAILILFNVLIFDGYNFREGVMNSSLLFSDITLLSPIDDNHNNYTTSVVVDDNDPRPLLVLHIGPHKTATSTIQCKFTYFLNLLKSKDFVYLGRYYEECQSPEYDYKNYATDTRKLIQCLDHIQPQQQHQQDDNVTINIDGIIKTSSSSCRSKFEDFQTTLMKLSKRQQNIVISDEAFSRMKINNVNLQFLYQLLNQYHQVKVVLVYRRYFSWLLSQYNEKYKPLPRRKQYSYWPSIPSSGEKKNHDHDEEDQKGGGVSYIRPFVDYYQKHSPKKLLDEKNHSTVVVEPGNYQFAAAICNIHPVMELKQKWNDRGFDNVSVLNMHEAGGGDIITKFATLLSPDIGYAFYNRTDNNAPSRPNYSMELDYDMLTVRARELGYLRQPDDYDDGGQHLRNRRIVSRFVEKKFKNKTKVDDDDLPRLCLNETQLNDLRNTSLQWEFDMFQNSVLQYMDQQSHKDEFDDYISKSKFCNLDVDEYLKRPDVQQFFLNL